MHGEFTWIDLSTFDVPAATRFYHKVFQWDCDADGSGYTYCSRSDEICAAIFEMPAFFRKIQMPSFWMTYIEVDDLQSTVGQARLLGGRIELEESGLRGEMALIRDPLGAGFTCYQGAEASVRDSSGTHGKWSWSELYVSDLEKIRDFYERLFRWQIKPDSAHSDRYAIINSRGENTGAVQVASPEMKGDKEFWAVFFTVKDAAEATDIIRSAGGTVYLEHEYSTVQGRHIVATDPQGATFFLTEQA